MDSSNRQFKYIALMRHGHAEPLDDCRDDSSRPLSLRGKYRLMETADGIAHVISSIGNVSIFASPKKRSVDTAKAISANIGIDPDSVHMHESISKGNLNELLDFASGFEGNPVIVGHEPFLSEWCQELTGDSLTFAKGSVCILEFDESRSKWRVRSNASPKYLTRLSRCSESCRFGAMTLRQLLDPLFSEIDKLRSSNPDVSDRESVHDMRVSVRKVRVALYALKPLIRREAYASLQSRFKDVMTATASLREVDMLKSSLKHSLGKNFDASKYDLFINSLRSNCEPSAAAIIQNFMQSGAADEALSEFERIAEHAFEPEVMRYLAQRFSRLSSRIIKLTRRASDLSDDALLHRIRIKCKSMRYFLEMFPFLKVSKPYRLLVYASFLQDILGNCHDIQTSRVLIEKNKDILGSDIVASAEASLESRRASLNPDIVAGLEELANRLNALIYQNISN